jgi:hypothetical protein
MGHIEVSLRVMRRAGLGWAVLFWLTIFTIGPLQVLCRWLGKGVTALSDLLLELLYRTWYTSEVERPKKQGNGA